VVSLWKLFRRATKGGSLSRPNDGLS